MTQDFHRPEGGQTDAKAIGGVSFRAADFFVQKGEGRANSVGKRPFLGHLGLYLFQYEKGAKKVVLAGRIFLRLLGLNVV